MDIKKIKYLVSMIACMFPVCLQAQNVSSPYSEVKGKIVISQFHSFDNLAEKDILLNALLWVIQYGPQPEEKVLQADYDKKQFVVSLVLEEPKTASRYRYSLSAKVSGNIITMLASDITHESEAAVIKLVKRTSFEKLQPDKKPKHKELMDEFAGMYKDCVAQMVKFISTNQLPDISHWDEIKNKEVVKGMNQAECLLALGKPASVQKQDNKEEWMYDAYSYLFFENGVVTSVIR